MALTTFKRTLVSTLQVSLIVFRLFELRRGTGGLDNGTRFFLKSCQRPWVSFAFLALLTLSFTILVLATLSLAVFAILSFSITFATVCCFSGYYVSSPNFRLVERYCF